MNRRATALAFLFLGCLWHSAILALVLLQGFGSPGNGHFHLDDRVLIFALLSTTANTWGIVFLLIRIFRAAALEHED